MAHAMKKSLVKREDVNLTVVEVAELDRCSVQTVRGALAAGLLTVVRIGTGGRSIRISIAAHAAYRKHLAERS